MIKQIFVWWNIYRCVIPDKTEKFHIEGLMSEHELNSLMERAYDYSEKNIEKFHAEGYLYKDRDDSRQFQAAFRAIPKGRLKIVKKTLTGEKITKQLLENYTLSGAKYGIYADEDCRELICDATVGDDGISDDIWLRAGAYYIREIKAPMGYGLDEKTYRVEIGAEEERRLEVYDKPLFSSFEIAINKVAEKGGDKNLSLAGAQYQIRYYKEQILKKDDADAYKPFKVWIFQTDEDGIIKFDKNWQIGGDELFTDEKGLSIAPIGSYVFEEIKAPKGFVKTEGILDIQRIEYDDKTFSINNLKTLLCIEEEQKISILLQKIDGETKKHIPQGYGSLEGAVYEVFKFDRFDEKDKKIGEIVTDKHGIGKMENLPPGLYYVMEKKPSKGYTLDREKKEVKGRVGRMNEKIFQYEVVSYETPTTVSVKKMMKDKRGINKSIAGAHLQLRDEEDNLIETWISTEEAKIFKGLSAGRYRIYEIKAPDGFTKLYEPYEFCVYNKKGVQSHEIINMPQGCVIIEKVDESGRAVIGAKLQIIDDTGNVLEEFFSTDVPRKITGLTYGRKYILREAIAPYGFEKAEDMEFTISMPEKEKKLLLVNRRVPVKTSDERNINELLKVFTMTVAMIAIFSLKKSI